MNINGQKMNKYTKKFLALLLCASLVALCGTVYTSASEKSGGENEEYAFAGEGSESEPYLIDDVNGLLALAESCNGGQSYEGKYFKLTSDLSLAGTPWKPIGIVEGTPFSGIFDGDGHLISELYASVDGDFGGLFGYIYNGSVWNLRLQAGNVSSLKYSGAVAGYISADRDAGAAIINCHVEAQSIKGREVGGIVGRAAAIAAPLGVIEIKASSASVKITSAEGRGANTYSGGIAGLVGAAVIDGCWVYDSTLECGASGESTVNAIGGLLGAQGASLRPAAVYNSYVVNTSVKLSEAAQSETSYVGGFIGIASNVASSELYNCFSSGIVAENRLEDAVVADFIGYAQNYILFDNCYSVTEKPVGADLLHYDYPVTRLTAEELSALPPSSLDKGNSVVIWLAGPDGHPVIDTSAVLQNEGSYTPFDIDDTYTAPDETTLSPSDETTLTPGDGTTPEPSDESTAGEATSAEGDETDGGADGGTGCSSSASFFGVGVSCAIIAFGLIWRKREE